MDLQKAKPTLRAKKLIAAFMVAIVMALAANVASATNAFAVVFNDTQGHWAQTSGVIDEAVDAGIIKGITNSDGSVSFKPDNQVTRAEVAVMLERMAGAATDTVVSDTTGFADTQSGTWFTHAINWAAKEGILTGSNNYVRPYDPITRQELATMLKRYYSATKTQITTYDADRLTKYTDTSSIATWAKDNVGWCVEYGIMGASSNLNPNGNATRAEASKMILVLYKGGDKQPSLMKVHYIDVGQGDSTFIELPDGKTMLIDAGLSSAGSTVASYIQNKGYTSIDYVVITHPDADHIGGMSYVLYSLGAGTIYTTGKESESATWTELKAQIAENSATKATAAKGVTVDSVNSLSATFVGPASLAVESASTNDSSAITSIIYGSTSWLFPGDASADVITSSVSGHYDVLKAAHHGSSTGTTVSLVSALSPKYAIISCGLNNSYGHPTASVLSALASVLTYRTDTSGTIDMFSDKTDIWSDVATQNQPTDTVGNDNNGNNNSGGNSDNNNSGNSNNNNGSNEITGGNNQTVTENNSTVVYRTKTGKKYHRDGCSSLSKSKIETTVAAAKAAGLEPCSKCNPPS